MYHFLPGEVLGGGVEHPLRRYSADPNAVFAAAVAGSTVCAVRREVLRGCCVRFHLRDDEKGTRFIFLKCLLLLFLLAVVDTMMARMRAIMATVYISRRT
jgi:hypothetical protein